jgi:metal-dependent amidase/aminoacylase/carboxypeptidase family protein
LCAVSFIVKQHHAPSSITPATVMGAEDFRLYQKKIPGLYTFFFRRRSGKPISETAPHHTPDFFILMRGFV